MFSLNNSVCWRCCLFFFTVYFQLLSKKKKIRYPYACEFMSSYNISSIPLMRVSVFMNIARCAYYYSFVVQKPQMDQGHQHKTRYPESDRRKTWGKTWDYQHSSSGQEALEQIIVKHYLMKVKSYCMKMDNNVRQRLLRKLGINQPQVLAISVLCINSRDSTPYHADTIALY